MVAIGYLLGLLSLTGWNKKATVLERTVAYDQGKLTFSQQAHSDKEL
jgi:hypothetical protein